MRPREWSTTVPGIEFRGRVLAVLTSVAFSAMVRDVCALVMWCSCSWLGAGTPRHGRSGLCHDVWAGPAAPFPGRLQLPDPARDERIAARRALERAAASRALDRFVGDLYASLPPRFSVDPYWTDDGGPVYCGRVGVCPGTHRCASCGDNRE